MKNIFTNSPFGSVQQNGVQGMGFRPGPVQVRVVGMQQTGHVQLGNAQPQRSLPFRSNTGYAQQQPSKQLEGDCEGGSCSIPPAAKDTQGNRIPLGQKGECPVCHTFGGNGRF